MFSDRYVFDFKGLVSLLKNKWWFFCCSFFVLSSSVVVFLFFSTTTTFSSTTQLMITTTGASYANYIYENTQQFIKSDYFYERVKNTSENEYEISLTKEEFFSSITLKYVYNTTALYINSFSKRQNLAYNISKICAFELIKLANDGEARKEFPYLATSDNVFGTNIKDYSTSFETNRSPFNYVGGVLTSFAFSSILTISLFGGKYGIFKKEE